MPSFSVLPGSEGFFLTPRWSLNRNLFPQILGRHTKDQHMLRFCSVLSALAAAVIHFALPAQAATFTESFSSNPLQHGWKTHGDAGLFQWDSTNQDLRVTWDSSQPNSYFYYPLETILARSDDFSVAFDLRLADVGVGSDTNKSGTFSIGLGFLNLDQATQTNFLRGTGVNSPDLAEFAYFWDSGFGATVFPTFVDTNSTFSYTGPSDYAIFALAPGDWYHIAMNYTASNQTLVATVTNLAQTSGVRIVQSISTNFTDYRLSAFSVSSYNDAGQDPQYAGSVLAHGTVDNLTLTVPAPPVQTVGGSFTNGLSQIEFLGQTNWLYTLQRTSDFKSWSDVSASAAGQAGAIRLAETNRPPDKAFYRIRASRP